MHADHLTDRPRRHGLTAIMRALLAVLLAMSTLLGITAIPASALTADEKYVTRLYADFLGRSPSPAELTWGAAVLANSPRSTYVANLLATAEFESRWITGTYQRYLVANPTSSQANAARFALDVSGNYLATEIDVLASSAYFSASGGTNSLFVTSLFQDLLWRDPDPSGSSYWTGQLDSGAKSRAQVATSIVRSNESAALRVAGLADQTECISTDLENIDDLASGSYCLVLDRLPDPSGASYWTGQLSGAGQLPALWSSLAGSNEYFNHAQQ